jgi:hypothetical protein
VETLAKFLNVPEPGPNETPPVMGSDPWDGAPTMREFAEKVLASKEYRASLYRRVLLDELPAQIEALLYYYAAGKPTERVEHTGKDGKPIESVHEVRRIIVHQRPQLEELDEDTAVERKVTH